MPGESEATIVQTCVICGARFQVYASVQEALCPTCGATNQIGARPVAQPRVQHARAVAARPAARPVVVIQESSAQGWLVLLMLLIMVGGGAAAWVFRDRIWQRGSKPIAAPMEEPAGSLPVDVDREYRLARMKLLDGDRQTALEAARTFWELDHPSVQQPLRNWIVFHGGLANLIAGEMKPAADRFRRLGERAPETGDAGLAAFFARCAELGASGEAIAAAESASLNPKNYESMGALMYGLQDWALGKVEEATAHFTAFGKATPEGDDQWIEEYKAIADDLVSDREQWQLAGKAFAEGKGTPDKLAAALDTVRTARRQLRSKRFTGEVTKMETELAELVAAQEAEKARMLAEREAAEAVGIVDLKKKTDGLAKEFRFMEALAAAKAGQFSTEKRQAEHRLIQRRMYSLARFQRNLAADLAAGGWREGITRADGKAVPGEVRAATDAAIGTVPWKEVSLDWLVKVAAHFIATTARLDYKSDRQFDLGILLLLHGRTNEADEWVTKAGDSKYEYLEAAVMLFEAAPADGATPKK